MYPFFNYNNKCLHTEHFIMIFNNCQISGYSIDTVAGVSSLAAIFLYTCARACTIIKRGQV